MLKIGEQIVSCENNEIRFERHFTKANWNLPDFGINFVSLAAHIENSIGTTIFHQDNVIVPDTWSQTAINILAQKYFRKVGVPQFVKKITEDDIPHWAARSIPIKDTPTEGENDLRQVARRLVGHWVYTGFKNNYFKDEEEGFIFADELEYMLYMQMAAPNSPQFFQTGLYWAYGIEGNKDEHWNCVSGDPRFPFKETHSYKLPQLSACFINKVDDKLIGPDSIMDLWTKEARVFKYGSGSGCNYSAIRGKGEPLSSGGTSSGLLSFLKIGDVTAGAIKSGGKTRRAARMVIVNDDHPDLLEFINWKTKEEEKAQALIEGSAVIRSENEAFPKFDPSFEGEVYQTISGQNANNSVRISDLFMHSVENKKGWYLTYRTCSDKECVYHEQTETILDTIANAAWKCGDPGIIFGDNVNRYNTCANDEEIIACNPCSEIQWFGDTVCNLASLNLLAFYKDKIFDIESFKRAITLWTTVLDISVSLAGYPSETIAKKTLRYRTLGLGYTNLGALLMVMGVPYDSEHGRNVAHDITALLTGQAYLTSANLADRLGSFPAYNANRNVMKDVLNKHYASLWNDCEDRKEDIFMEACNVWENVYAQREFRNAQVTALAPTGTISLLMDCQTTGIEPDFALVKYKELAGGGNIKLVNQAVKQTLDNLGYEPAIRDKIINFIGERGSIDGCNLVAPSNYSIFDCANDIKPSGHLELLAFVQPFISGGISKTINLPNSATVEDIKKIYYDAWRFGLKCVSVYRDGCKASQPLTHKKSFPKEVSPSEDEQIQEVTQPKTEIVFYNKQNDAYNGNETLICPTCGSSHIRQTGVCMLCEICGASLGGC